MSQLSNRHAKLSSFRKSVDGLAVGNVKYSRHGSLLLAVLRLFDVLGKELLRRLSAHKIRCTYILLSGLSYVRTTMKKVCACVRACICVGVCACVHVYVCICVGVRMCVCMSIGVCVCQCVHSSVHVTVGDGVMDAVVGG